MKKLIKKSLLSILALSALLSFSNFNNVQAKEINNLTIDKNDFDFEITPAYAWDFIHGYQNMASISTFAAWTDSGSYKFKVPSERDGTGRDIVFTGYINGKNKHLVYRLKEKIKLIGQKENELVTTAAGLGFTVVTAGGVGPIAFLVAGSASWKLKNLFNEINSLYSEAYDLQHELR